MKKPEMPQVWQAISCLLCVFFALKITDGLAGTEFSGGRLTGPLLSMADIGSFFFVIALVVTFVYPRVAAVVGLASSLLPFTALSFLHRASPVQSGLRIWARA
jgi:hypothetical protein